MKFDLENTTGYAIHSYAVGAVTLSVPPPVEPQAAPDLAGNRKVMVSSFILSPEQLIANWPPQSPADLQTVHFDPVLSLEPEIILLGSGPRLEFPDPAITQHVYQLRIGLDVMDTTAACRTYNILAAEGRRVVAALMMI